MPRKTDKRERLLAAAKELIHQQGFHQTSLADISQASDVPLGNVYYYYKTKEDIGNAVVEQRLQDMRDWLQGLDKFDDPRTRLLAFLDMPLSIRTSVAEYGCPVGSLCQELSKEDTALSHKADAVLGLQIDWATKQFRKMQLAEPKELGIQFIATLQGMSLVASSLHNPGIVKQQVKRLERWLQQL